MGTNEVYYCPLCGDKMIYVGGLLDYECPNCGAEGSLEYDEINKTLYVSVAEEYDMDDILFDDCEPYCCKACGGPYPDCLSSCKIFDD